MPYVDKNTRIWLDEGDVPTTPGELNYTITTHIKRYIDGHGLSYATINDVIGALEGAKLEFYRRIAAPYEDSKIVQNGDVYV